MGPREEIRLDGCGLKFRQSVGDKDVSNRKRLLQKKRKKPTQETPPSQRNDAQDSPENHRRNVKKGESQNDQAPCKINAFGHFVSP